MDGPRGVKEDEFNDLLKLVNYVFRESRGKPADMAHKNATFYYNPVLNNMRVIVEDQKIVSHIGILESEIITCGCRVKTGNIADVCTHPEYRGKGYATELMRDCLRLAEENGIDILRISGDRGLYRKSGCVKLLRGHRLRIDKERMENLCSGGRVEVFPCGEKDLPDMVKIYQQEPVRFHRPLETFREGIEGFRSVETEKNETLLVGGNYGPAAYLLVSCSLEAGGDGKRAVNVVEYAGARSIIFESLKTLFLRYGADEINFQIPFFDTEFINLLEENQLGLSDKWESSFTGKILDFPRLMSRFGKYLEERLGAKKAGALHFSQKGDRCAIHFSGKVFETDISSISETAFGEMRENERFAIAPDEETANVLSAIFPLPLPLPGFINSA